MTTNAELQALREQYVPLGAANMSTHFADRAENGEIFDIEGRRFIDFAGGIGVLNVGHRHPKVVAAVEAQMQKLMHTCFHVMPYEPYIRLAKKLCELTPGTMAKKAFLVNTGAEAVENAIKIARAATKRSAVIAFNGGFHGRTMMGMALTGKVVPYKVGFGPFPGGVYHVPYPNEYHKISVQDSLTALHNVLKNDIEASTVAAIIIEPVQGEGGFYAAPKELLEAVRALCDQHGIVMIADEVQSGFGRTGKLFAMEHSGVVPDLMTMAKSMAGGMTLAGVVGRAELLDAPVPGSIGSTYGGSPMACAAALAVIEVIEEENLLQRSEQVGKLIAEHFEGLKSQFACVDNVRNQGAMVAMELVKDRDSRTPDPDMAKALTVKAQQKGLILLSCGIYANTIRVLVPLTAPDALIREGLELITASLAELTQ
ncbi:4-aminobutyrate aminotransferase / (S)-3-amino-2-methylpropionate transaminase [Oceanospirillum multiglobuliferum]|uniref:4-aminobutyrate--2-oxoglutarate transaminase n=2 Tax=Oceanospirillum TaxID=965 RepID=A0A1T4QAQ9_9GAMM|nr:4-aminobutyrate--2-oxoglutarate transaminase [Oceanospirillum multiglobuliferum]OPX56555.1 4-aminobutyrate--2-oxoglutarate transaminase [Oceanospirillum multiglobuliferum]SKA00631.1 4-aminobutyrate aminotransferase / (S)-3-amino-2-methylpropionate transaminase [Oceanospirillum multiglobuliferum]